MNFKKVLSCVLAMLMLVSMFSVTAFAEDDYVPADKLVSKTATDVGNGNYKVELKVPGETPDNTHDEVILMVDGSYSNDEEWNSMIETIIGIGKTVLNGSGNTQLTLMAFGMGDNEVLVHAKDVETLAAVLGELPGSLLYGRSSTNNEAGFIGVAEYIANHDSTLDDVYVFYISDGRVNTDETPANFFDWKNNGWHSFSEERIINDNFDAECEAIAQGANRSNAFLKVFGDGDLEAIYAAATYEQKDAYNAQIWADVFEEAGLDPNGLYPISVVERAFVDYDNKHNTYIQDNFYYALIGRGYPNRVARTIAAATALAAMEQVVSMHIIDSDETTAWMQQVPGVEFVPAGSVAQVLPSIADSLYELAKTQYSAVTVTDYMSKWVNLDQTTIAVVDDTTGQVIWNNTEGWLINSGRPTSKEKPVEITVVPVEEYPLGGAEVMGNTSGEIIKLTWYLKDANLLRSDSYHLEYIVSLDEAEEGYEAGCLYDANGATTVYYIDDEGNTYQEDIPVPVIGDPSADAVGKVGNVRIDTAEKMAVRFEDGSVYYDNDMKEMEYGVEYKFQLCAVNWETGTYDDNDNGLAGTVVYTAKLVDQDEFNRLREEALKNPERYTVKGIDIIDNDAKTIIVNGDAIADPGALPEDYALHLETDVNNFFMAYRFHFTGEDYDKQTGIVGVVNTPVESLSVNLPLGATITCDAYISFKQVGSADILITNNSGEGIYENTELTSVNDYTWPY